RVFPLLNEAPRREVVNEGAIHLPVEIEVEVVERALGIPKAGLLEPAGDEPILAADEFVADEGRHEIDGGLFLGLGLAEARVERRGHARESELAQGVIEFDEVHAGSPVWRSMRSRYSVSWRMSGSICLSVSGAAGRRSR